MPGRPCARCRDKNSIVGYEGAPIYCREEFMRSGLAVSGSWLEMDSCRDAGLECRELSRHS